MTWLLRCFVLCVGDRTSPLRAMCRPLTLDGLSAFIHLRTLRCLGRLGVTAFAIHALSSFQRTGCTELLSATCRFPVARPLRPPLQTVSGEPSKVTTATSSCQALGALRRVGESSSRRESPQPAGPKPVRRTFQSYDARFLLSTPPRTAHPFHLPTDLSGYEEIAPVTSRR
jgi:hypothetical protein